MKRITTISILFLSLFGFLTLYTPVQAGAIKTLYSWVKDAAGNVSNSLNDTVDITLPASNTYYISPSGSDATGNGSITTPWASLYKACNSVTTSGKTIHINAGTYTETQPCNLAVGVSIEGEGQDNTIINSTYSFSVIPAGDFTKASIVLTSATLNTPGNQTISKLTLDGGWTPTSTNTTTATRGILVRGRGNVTITNVHVKNFWVAGIGFFHGYPYTQATVRMDGNVLSYSTLDNCGNGYPKTNVPAGIGYEGSGLIELFGQSNMLVHHNVLKNNTRGPRSSDIISRWDWCVGIKVYNNEFWKPEYIEDGEEYRYNFAIETWNIQGGVEIYDNDFFGGYIPVDLGGPVNTKGTYDYSTKIYNNRFIRTTTIDASTAYSRAIQLESSTEISDVFIYDNYIENFPQVFGIIDGALNVASIKRRIYFYNNLAVNSKWLQTWTMPVVSISMVQSATSILSDLHIVNNTFVGTEGKSQYGVDLFVIGTTSNVFIKNNIFQQLLNGNSQGFVHMGSTKGVYTTGARSDIHIENNLTYLTGNNNNVSYTGAIAPYTNINQIKQSPLFVSSTDFHLQSISPAINAGQIITLPVVGTLPYNGIAPDIGAYEY